MNIETICSVVIGMAIYDVLKGLIQLCYLIKGEVEE